MYLTVFVRLPYSRPPPFSLEKQVLPPNLFASESATLQFNNFEDHFQFCKRCTSLKQIQAGATTAPVPEVKIFSVLTPRVALIRVVLC